MRRVHFLRMVAFLLVVFHPGYSAQGADEFGQFFTAPAQREKLDALRRTGPEVTIEISDSELETAEATEAQANPRDAVTLKGVVQRSDGANTAWVNESNTNEGDLASQDIRVRESRIGDNQVELNIGGHRAPITLKVGETYDPATDEVINKTPVPDGK